MKRKQKQSLVLCVCTFFFAGAMFHFLTVEERITKFHTLQFQPHSHANAEVQYGKEQCEVKEEQSLVEDTQLSY